MKYYLMLTDYHLSLLIDSSVNTYTNTLCW